MSANPNPAVIPDGLWRLWEEATLIIPGVRLGGIYAYKSGYHNTVLNNRAAWPNDYSIRLDIDNSSKPTDKARALDLTMDSAQMKLRTGYLQRAALHPDDNRLDCMREFYGTLNGSTVYGLSHDGPGQAWYSVSSDDSHLWHIHDSFFTPYVNDWAMLAPVLSVLEGVTWEAYQGQGGGPSPSPSEEDDMRLVREPNGSVWLIGSLDRETGRPTRSGVGDPPQWERYAAALGGTPESLTVQLDGPMSAGDWCTLPIAASGDGSGTPHTHTLSGSVSGSLSGTLSGTTGPATTNK